MSRINGEKARAAIAHKRRSAQRVKDRETRAKLAGTGAKAQTAAQEAKTAEKPKRAAAAKTPDQLIDELRPSKKRSGSAEKSE